MPKIDLRVAPPDGSRQRLLAFNPQVTIEKAEGGVWNPGDLQPKIAALPGVVAIAPYVSTQVMVVGETASGAPAYVSGGILRGVVTDLHAERTAIAVVPISGRHLVPFR